MKMTEARNILLKCLNRDGLEPPFLGLDEKWNENEDEFLFTARFHSTDKNYPLIYVPYGVNKTTGEIFDRTIDH